MLFYHALTFFIPLATAIFFAFLFWREKLTYPSIILSNLLVFFGTWLLVNKKIQSQKQILFYSSFSLLICLSGFVLLLFIENFWLKIGLVILVIILLYYYINELFIQYFKKPLLNLKRLWLFFRLAQVFIIFLSASSLFGLRDFLSTPLVFLIIVFFFLAIILNGYNNWQNWDIQIKRLFYRALMALLIAELFWGVSLLPFVYYLKGIIVAIFYALLNELIIWHFERKPSVKLMKVFLIFAFLLIILIMVTAQWS